MENQYQEISAPSLLSLFETTKEQRQSFANQVLHFVKEGGADPRKVLLQAKCVNDIMTAITEDEDFKKIVIAESEKNGKVHEFMNAKFEVKEAGVKYDYSQCNDDEYDDLVKQKEALDKKLKDREKFLKNAPQEGVRTLNEDTGEITMIYPPSKSSKTIVAVTLK